MAGGISQKTRRLTVCAVLCALNLVIMYFGSVIEVLDLTASVVASLACVFAVIEMGGRWPWLIYAVTGVLSLVLLPLQRNQNVKRYGKGDLSQRLDRLPALGNDTRVLARRVAAAATSAPKIRCKIPHSSGDSAATTHIARDAHRLG